MIKSSGNFNLHTLLKNIDGNKLLDYRNRTRIDERFIPQLFNQNIAFISFSSFQQNQKALGMFIRRFIKLHIDSNDINAIGGESYLYSSNRNTNFYTNSESVLKDYIYNQYRNGRIINYNNDELKLLPLTTVINISKLNINLMREINNSSSTKLIIINCHHNDFWKKINLLSNYKLIIRKKFIDSCAKYFITANILIRKS